MTTGPEPARLPGDGTWELLAIRGLVQVNPRTWMNLVQRLDLTKVRRVRGSWPLRGPEWDIAKVVAHAIAWADDDSDGMLLIDESRLAVTCGVTQKAISGVLSVLQALWLLTYVWDPPPTPRQPARLFLLTIPGDIRQVAQVWTDSDLRREIKATRAKNRRVTPRKLRTQVFERDGYRCVKCGETERLQTDHIIPWTKGGLTVLENLQTLCITCNTRKYGSTSDDSYLESVWPMALLPQQAQSHLTAPVPGESAAPGSNHDQQ